MGCDAPVYNSDGDAMPQIRGVTCPRCDGTKDTCERCGGRGTVDLYRCPAHYQTPDITAALRARRWSEKSMPIPGGFLDQAASWVAFCSVFDGERNLLLEEERKAAESKAKAQKRAHAKGRRR